MCEETENLILKLFGQRSNYDVFGHVGTLMRKVFEDFNSQVAAKIITVSDEEQEKEIERVFGCQANYDKFLKEKCKESHFAI